MESVSTINRPASCAAERTAGNKTLSHVASKTFIPRLVRGNVLRNGFSGGLSKFFQTFGRSRLANLAKCSPAGAVGRLFG